MSVVCYFDDCSAHDWNISLIKEMLLAKQKLPKLNNCLKVSKDLKYFN